MKKYGTPKVSDKRLGSRPSARPGPAKKGFSKGAALKGKRPFRPAEKAVKKIATRGPLVMGKHSIEELLKHDPSRFVRVLVAQGGSESRGPRHMSLIEQIEKAGVPIEAYSREAIDELVESTSHQSFVAELTDRQFINLKDWVQMQADAPNGLILALDAVQDPQNLGSLLRAAECFGVDLIVWSKHRVPGITPVVTSASVGASELVQISQVSNLAESLKLLEDSGYEIVVADGEGESAGLWEHNFAPKTVLVLGSEGKGVQDLIMRRAKQIVKIPLSGAISSLSVVQAGAILLSAYRRINPAQL